MQVTKLLDGVSATGASDSLVLTSTASKANVSNYTPVPYAVVQVEISNTATVQIRGRTSTDMSWVVIDTLTSSGAIRGSMFPIMDVNVSAYTSGTVSAELAA